jgi:Xaa-Pro aminopeptidase
MALVPVDEQERARRLLEAQERAAALFAAVDDGEIIRPGVTESEASDAIRDLAAAEFGMPRHWHKRIVRSGPNTVRTYQEEPPDRRLEVDDIAFADFGPIFDGWEADFGRTWVIGDDPVKHRLRDDLERVFVAGRAHFESHHDITGEQLYEAVVAESERLGWSYGNWHCGHLVGEYPHEDLAGDALASRIARGATDVMRRRDPSGRVAHWILEVHLVDVGSGFGGFYEELLTL